jgi:sterol desaturase/sphingolipid hydroxylase (fatty acid hydroxylase superfamily)
MQSIVDYFEQIPSWQRALILAGGILFFWVVEGLVPLFRFRYNKLRHAGINIFFTVTTIVVNFALAFALAGASELCTHQQVGVYYWLQAAPLWVKVIIACMVMDLVGAYFVHWMEHKVKWMWRFHLVHHTDTFVDTTTANRHHPGESVFRAFFTACGILVAGAPFGVVMLYQSASALLSQFNHANIVLPRWIDRPLSWLIVSPNMHKVHHHYAQPYTDTNYGNIFSVWDRLFGTFVYVADMKTLHYGIDTHLNEKEHSHIGNLLEIPFQPYRPAPGSKFAGEQEAAEAAVSE